jgi:hypothetical protein
MQASIHNRLAIDCGMVCVPDGGTVGMYVGKTYSLFSSTNCK